MAARKTKCQKALELLRDNPGMAVAEAARKAKLKDVNNIHRMLSKNYGGMAEWRAAGCPI